MTETKRTDAIQGEIVHVYDGIEEADNSLPLWWLATFYGGIVFAVLYWFGYQVLPIGTNPADEYAAEMTRRAESGGEMTDSVLEAVASSDAEVSAGRALFAQHCAVCHGARGEGVIGPNLTDSAWLHGGAPTAIHTTIRDGVTSKGMPNWGAPLGATAVRRLAAFVISLRGTNVPGKEAQGDPYVPGGPATP